MDMTLTLATDEHRAAWNEFMDATGVQHHAYAWEWRDIIANCFDHTPYYFIARSLDGDVVGALPLFHMKSVLFGTSLISLPYLNAGGLVVNNSLTAKALLDAATDLATELKAGYLEFRHREPILDHKSLSLVERSHKAAMLLALQQDAEAMFQAFPPKLRSQIRRPSKSGIEARVQTGSDYEPSMLDGFYSVFAQHMRDLGTPVYPRKLFAETLQAFGKRARIIVAWKDNRAVAAGITIRSGETIEIPWASSLREFNKESPNMLLYWQAIKSACEEGARAFDFGRSTPDSGPYRFKRQWGAEPLPLHWYYPAEGSSIPDVNPNSKKFALLVECWKRLPLSIANALGPWVTKNIP